MGSSSFHLQNLLPSPMVDEWTSTWLDPTLYRLNQSGTLPGLDHLIDETLLYGGKRLRPLLTAEFGRLFGIDADRIRPFAIAAEHIHSATLAHDDVIDESETRRGRSTLNARIENRRAVLGGDYLLAEGLSLVANESTPEIFRLLTGTLRELVSGEILQNEARWRAEVGRAHLGFVADLKTSSLFRWCCGVAPTLVSADASIVRLVRDFATHIGLAFQWIDDALDFSETSGKPLALDLREGLMNRVSQTLVENRPESLREIQAAFARREITTLPWTPEEIRRAQLQVRSEAREQLTIARVLLEELRQGLPESKQPARAQSLRQLRQMMDLMEGREK